MKKRAITILLILATLIIIFWLPICFNNEFFYDDLSFIEVFKSGSISIGYFLKPHNEHFMPLFKAVFLGMYKLFNLNIAPYMLFAIGLHVINCLLLYVLLNLIFSGRRFLLFALTLFFALNTVYYETLHWFVNTSLAFTMFFLLTTLILLHKSVTEKNKKMYYGSLITSFFIPMNSSFGLLGIIYIISYVVLILKKTAATRLSSSKSFSRRFLIPYFLVWLSFLAIYSVFALPSVLNKPATAPAITFNLGNVFLYVLLGFVGLMIRNFAFSSLVFPYTTGLAVFLAIIFIFFALFLLLYFILNKKKERIAVFGRSPIALFALINMTLCFLVLAFTRSSLGVESFLNWGRYYYFPMLFFTLLLGVVIPQIIEIFSKVFNRDRFKVFLVIIFVVFIATHFVLLRQKAESPIRTEGALEDKNTSAGIWVTTARA